MASTNLTPWKPRPLTTNEQAAHNGMTHIATITANDLTVAADNTLQTFTLCTLKAGDIITQVAWRIKTFFKDTGNTGYNDNTLSVGYTADVAGFIAAIQINENGTEVRQGYSNTAVHFAAADIFSVTFNSMASEALLQLDTGEIEIVFGLFRPAILEQSVSSADLTK